MMLIFIKWMKYFSWNCCYNYTYNNYWLKRTFWKIEIVAKLTIKVWNIKAMFKCFLLGIECNINLILTFHLAEKLITAFIKRLFNVPGVCIRWRKISICRCKTLRTPGNALIVNLAISDTMMLMKTPLCIYNCFQKGPALGDVGNVN